MKVILRITALLTIIPIITSFSMGAIPHHTSVLQKIEQGEIAEPYYLRHQEELRERGVNAAWSAPELQLQRAIALTPPARTLGPALVPAGEYKALAILVDFSDQVQQVEATFFDSLMFSTTGISVWDYYQDVSYGALEIVGVEVDLPSAVDWVRAPQTYNYYVNAQNGLGNYPQNAQKLVEDVVNAVDNLVDFSQYDNDGDGYVDGLFIVHSGRGAEWTGSDDDIWSHAWVTANSPVLDGVRIYRYSMEPEYWITPGDMTIGVYVHEMGHSIFGLPDLYDRDEVTPSNGLGRWSLMAGGSWNGVNGDSPAFPDAWCHVQMGYVMPTDVETNSTAQSISNVESSAQAYRLWQNGTPGDEYFLVENRQQLGYDAALPGSGLLIYHVDMGQLAGVDPPQNDNEWYPGYTGYGHYLVALEQADSLWELEKALDYGDSGDPYPGSTGNTTFDFGSTPDSRDYNGNDTHVAVTNIATSGELMTADFFVEPQEVAPPQLLAINDVPGDQGGWVTVTWTASEDDSENSPNQVLFYSIWIKDTAGGDAAAPLTVRSIEEGIPESVILAVDGWIGVGSLGAVQDSSYRFLVHTLQDSNQTGINWTYVRISAHAADPYDYSVSEVDSGYSVDNIEPSVPTDLAATPGKTGIELSWSYDLEAVPDLQYFAIYRGKQADFKPIHPDSTTYRTEDTVFVDENLEIGVRYYYCVAAVDYNGNYSDLTRAADGAVLPVSFALRQNYPNPFNPNTTIIFEVPDATSLSLIIYDILGRELVHLHEGYIEPGYHQLAWNGMTDAGVEAPTGIYILRMATPGYTGQVKMVLMK